MPISNIIVTPLPHGLTTIVGGATGHLSVHLAPRLRVGGRLRDYLDWRRWPTFFANQNMQLQVRIDGIDRATTRVSAAPRADVWQAVFGAPAVTDVLVRPWTFVRRQTANLVSHDPTDLADRVISAYDGLATGLGDDAITAAIVQDLADDLFGPGGLLGPATGYYAPTGNSKDPGSPDLEFHQALTHLSAHPALLRALGLVIDLDVALPPSFSKVEVFLVSSPIRFAPMPVAVTPTFQPVVGDTTLYVDRWLKLSEVDRFEPTTVDIAGLAQRFASFETVLEQAAATDPVDLPSLDEVGVVLWQRRRAADLIARWDRQAAVEAGIDEHLTAPVPPPVNPIPTLLLDDLVVGHRFDIMRNDNQFRSVFERKMPGGFEFPRNPALSLSSPQDEGWLSPALFTDGNDVLVLEPSTITYGEGVLKRVVRDDTTWRVPDSAVTWRGWSLGVGRPGNAMDADGSAIVPPANAAPPTEPVQVIADYEVVNGTLPRLRYNDSYRVRARVVDLSGHSLALADTAPPAALTEAVPFGRMSPVDAPVSVRRLGPAAPAAGDTLDTLVIRSDLLQVDSTVVPDERLYFPPSLSQPQVELHDLPAGGVDPASYQMLADRDAASVATQTVIDPVTGDPVAGTLVGDDVVPGPLRPPITYLTDPAAELAAFSGLRATSVVQTMPFGSPWPDRRGVRLLLRAGTGAPRRTVSTLTITTFVPKGRIQTVEVSAGLKDTLLGDFFWWLRMGVTDQDANRSLLLDGRHALFSNRRVVQLVHAVRQPLLVPSLTGATLSRLAAGGTQASVDVDLGVDRPSTGSLSIQAQWVDPVDDPAAPEPGEQTRRSPVGRGELTYEGAVLTASLSGLVFDLHDTKRHLVELTATAFSRYSSYFTEQSEIAFPSATASVVLDAAGVVGSSVTLELGGQELRRDVDFTVQPAAGTVTRTASSAIPIGATVVSRFIPRPTSRESTEGALAPSIVVDLAASLAPVAPEVDVVLPAFDRAVAVTSTTIQVTHDGRGLRVLLDRPWYSSGVGELLGVAIEPGGGTGVATRTVFARDVTRAGTGPGKPVLADFGGTTATATAGTIGASFDVAGYTTTFDPVRQVWTADVRVTRDLYRPFVQLALCRFQPNAISGQHVSPVVATDAVRVGARRVVLVTRGVGQVTVKLTGPDDTNVVKVVVQESDPTIDDPDLRWHDVGSVTILARTGTTTAAVHEGVVTLPATSTNLRVVVEDREIVTTEVGGALVPTELVAYREVVPLPPAWT